MNLENIKIIAISFASLIGAITFIKGYFEYRLAAKQKRYELYDKYRKKLEENENLRNIVDLLETENPAIQELTRFNRYKFIGFYEDIALLLNSGLIKPEIAHYMFSYYAILCWESDPFWEGINRNSAYWRVFREFVESMQKLESNNLTIPTNEKLKFEM
jgi:hypothetical protein